MQVYSASVVGADTNNKPLRELDHKEIARMTIDNIAQIKENSRETQKECQKENQNIQNQLNEVKQRVMKTYSDFVSQSRVLNKINHSFTLEIMGQIESKIEKLQSELSICKQEIKNTLANSISLEKHLEELNAKDSKC
jgi:uncharacterized membrane-anchored protein YhcB (DUF1043 family)